MSEEELIDPGLGLMVDTSAQQSRSEAFHQEYQRIMEELVHLVDGSGMSVALMLIDHREDGTPDIDQVGIDNIRQLLKPLGYAVVKEE